MKICLSEKTGFGIVSLFTLFLLTNISYVMGDTILEQIDFDNPDFKLAYSEACETEVEDGMLKVKVLPGEFQLVLPQVDIDGPLIFEVKMRSGKGMFGQAEVFWQSNEDENWSQSRLNHVYLKHDWQWHTYKIPLSLYGQLKQVRFDPGWQQGEIEIDYIRYIKDEVPVEKKKAAKEISTEVIKLSNELLDLEFDAAKYKITVQDKRTSRKWFADFSENRNFITDVAKKGNNSITFSLWDNATKSTFEGVMTLKDGGFIEFDLLSDNYSKRFSTYSNFPPKFYSDFETGKLIFCNRSSGMYLDQSDDYPDWQNMLVYGNLSLDMPWVGVVDENTGEGLMVLAKTPCDAFINLEKDDKGKRWPQIFWWESLDSFRYPRKMAYYFSSKGGYVALAKKYRDIAAGEGKLVTLEQKAQYKPNLEKLRGAPFIWGATDAWTFVSQARTYGIRKGVISNSHHGLSETGSLQKINNLGYITNEYGNVSDILPGEESQLTGDIEKSSYYRRPDMGPATGWVMPDGTQYYSRSSVTAMNAAKVYLPKQIYKYGFNGGFLDVSAAIDLFEDYHPMHTFDRRQDMQYRREFFEYYNKFGLVLGTEHGNDWAVDLIDYSEGSAGGPLWWKGGWDAGNLQRPKSMDKINPDYIKYGLGFTNSIPLWQLVYHDCVVSTWYWGDTQGFLYEANPEFATRKDLSNILYGTVPLFWRDEVDYDWAKNRSRFLKSYYETCRLNEKIAFDRLLDHKFLSDDKELQMCRFDSGFATIVNFGKDEKQYKHEGKMLNIAPEGFYVQGPGLCQSREMVDGNLVTKIIADDFYRIESSSEFSAGPVSVSGTATVFNYSLDRWHIILEDASDFSLNINALKNVDLYDDYRLFTINETGDLIDEVTLDNYRGKLELGLKKTTQMFALLLNQSSVKPYILPQTKTLERSQKVKLSVLNEDVLLRYTIDGSEPTMQSKVYEGPFTIDKSLTVKARVFDKAGYSVIPTVRHHYDSVEYLFKSGLLEGGGTQRDIDINVENAEKLTLIVSQSDNLPWYDYADWVDMTLVDNGGNEHYLSDMKPSKVSHDHSRLGVNTRVGGDGENHFKPLTLGGKVYDKGIGMKSPSKIEFDLGGRFTRLRGKAGIDDSAGAENGHLELFIRATY